MPGRQSARKLNPSPSPAKNFDNPVRLLYNIAKPLVRRPQLAHRLLWFLNPQKPPSTEELTWHFKDGKEVFGMAFFKGDIYSSALGMNTTLHLVLPGDTHPGDKPPKVVYLLHGLSDNGSSWSRMTSVERYANRYGFAVVMPSGERGFYQDMKHGLQYFSYISQELPRLTQKLFCISSAPEDTFIAGLSMGGYGTLRCVLSNPGAYGAAAAFSSVADIRRWRRGKEERGMMLGELAGMWGEGPIPDEADLYALAQKVQGCPRLYLACGEQDPLLEVNQAFYHWLTEKGHPAVLETWQGGHDWAFWDVAIQKAFAFFAGE